MNSMKRQKDITLENELPRSVGAQYATEEDSSKKLDSIAPKRIRDRTKAALNCGCDW